MSGVFFGLGASVGVCLLLGACGSPAGCMRFFPRLRYAAASARSWQRALSPVARCGSLGALAEITPLPCPALRQRWLRRLSGGRDRFVVSGAGGCYAQGGLDNEDRRTSFRRQPRDTPGWHHRKPSKSLARLSVMLSGCVWGLPSPRGSGILSGPLWALYPPGQGWCPLYMLDPQNGGEGHVLGLS